MNKNRIRLTLQQALRHLAAATIAGAEDKYSFHRKLRNKKHITIVSAIGYEERKESFVSSG